MSTNILYFYSSYRQLIINVDNLLRVSIKQNSAIFRNSLLKLAEFYISGVHLLEIDEFGEKYWLFFRNYDQFFGGATHNMGAR